MKNLNNNDKGSKNKNSIPIIIISIVVTISAIAIYIGMKNVNASGEENISLAAENNNKTSTSTEDKAKEVKTEEPANEKAVPTKSFNDFSDEYLMNLVTEVNTVLKDMRGKRLFEKIEEKDRTLYPLPTPYETIEKRKIAIDKYFMPGLFKENYTTKDGTTYVEAQNNQFFSYAYYFISVASREETGDILRVKFNIDPVEGFRGVSRSTKTVEFKIKDGELKLNSKSFEDCFLNFAENINDTNDIDYSKKEKELYATVESKLSKVLRPDQKFNGFLSIEKYPLSDDKAYGICISEPTQNAICYFVNIRTGEIYGHYERRVVAK